MARNTYFSQGSVREKDLYEDMVVEALSIYGQDVYYIPRDIVSSDDIINETIEWCKSENESKCKYILKRLSEEKNIFLGEFVKALLKINNISAELETVSELYGNIELLSKLKEIPEKTMKFVATNQSLYV